MSADVYLKAIEDALMAFLAGDYDRPEYDRAVEAALRAWRAAGK